jgi:hypothetical protein
MFVGLNRGLGSKLLLTISCCGFLLHSTTMAQQAKPNPPITGKYSVQLFEGNTQKCLISVYPPLNYVNGQPFKADDKVEIKFYRSFDGGKTYGTKGVKVVKQEFKNYKDPETGQARFDPARIDWIDCLLETPVDPPKAEGDKHPGKDTTVYLACSIVVNGVESDSTNRFLTFAYAIDGIPGLVRYEKPAEKEQPVPMRKVNVPPQVLTDRGGTWSGNYMFTTYTIVEDFKKSPEFKEEGCQKFIQMLDASLGKSIPLKIHLKSMVADSPPGKSGKRFFPGTAEITFNRLDAPTEPGTPVKANVVYYPHQALVIFEGRDAQNGLVSTSILVGNVFENQTHYQMSGSFKLRISMEESNRSVDMMVVHGLWTVERQK